MELGELITIYRKQAGMTIDELAEKSGVPKGTLTKIIGGVTKAPTLQNVKAIARSLGKTLADFDDPPFCHQSSPALLPPIVKRIVDIASNFNEEGQEKLLEHAQLLDASGSYKKYDKYSVAEKEA